MTRRKLCPVQSERWRVTDRSPELLTENHKYKVGTEDVPLFARLEEFWSEVPTSNLAFVGELPTWGTDCDKAASKHRKRLFSKKRKRTPAVLEERLNWENPLPSPRSKVERACECGAPSAWDCFAEVYSQVLLGGERVCRTGRGYTVYPDDEAVNNAILGIANKYIPAHFVEGVPCEEFRDLCNELVLSLHTYANGTTSTYFLPKMAAAYLRANGAAQTLTTSRLRKPNYNKGQTND